METFYIFGFGVIFALSIMGIIYSVMVISKVKKQSDDATLEVEELTELLNNVERDMNVQLMEVNSRLDNEINEFSRVINDLNSLIDSRFDKFSNKIRDDYDKRFEEIEDDIENINRNSQIMRETL